jgi:hypothetical protein
MGKRQQKRRRRQANYPAKTTPTKHSGHGACHMGRHHGGTHTYATLDVDVATWEDVGNRLKEAGYGHLVPSTIGEPIDMHGIALTVVQPPDQTPGVGTAVGMSPVDTTEGGIEPEVSGQTTETGTGAGFKQVNPT